MWDIQILGVDLYHVLFWLILYSFMGWDGYGKAAMYR